MVKKNCHFTTILFSDSTYLSERKGKKTHFLFCSFSCYPFFVIFQEFELTSSTIEHANCCEIGTDFAFSNDPFDESSSSSFFPLASFQFSISRHWTFNGKWTIKLKIKSQKMKSSKLLHQNFKFCRLYQQQHRIFYQSLFLQDYDHRFIHFIPDHIRIHYCHPQKCRNFHHGE